MTERPEWFDEELLPYESRWVSIEDSEVHYLDVGQGPVLLMLHGNPTWSFLYRRLIAGLAEEFRCIAIDYPGFGLSRAAPGYGFTPAEHSRVVQGFVADLGLTGVTPIMQDWGGPIGLAAVEADPDRYRGLIIGNTWAWPAGPYHQAFSQVMGGRFTADLMSRRLNLFVGQLVPRSMNRRSLTEAERSMYRGPFPTVASRTPVAVFPREIRASREFLAGVASGLPAIADLPTLLLWADRDIAFRDAERRRWQELLGNRADHTLHGAGHYWQDDAGEEAALVIRRWAAENLVA